MKIAQVAPLIESVPPKLYGGTERVVSNLTEELVRQGHEVTLFASGDSQTAARLIAGAPRALRLARVQDAIAPHVLMLERVLSRVEEFDVVHFHVAPLHFPLARRLVQAHVTTLHGRLDLPELVPLFDEYADLPCVSISNAQRAPLRHVNWVGTVHHGLPTDLLTYHEGPGSYLAFLGRMSPEKGPERAIAIARASGHRLRIAAKVDAADKAYFEERIEPLLDDPLVEFIGEIDDSGKDGFLGGARALLFPIDWPEPFGISMIESLACGTPVVAFRGGSVDEVIDSGVTGFVVETIEDAVEAVQRIDTLDRRACRAAFEERFAVRRMADAYVDIYARVIGARAASLGVADACSSTSCR